MKKLILFLLCISLLLSSCGVHTGGETGSASSESTTGSAAPVPSVPYDEEKAEHTVSAVSDDGIVLKITAHGYRSQSENRNFYAKSNEYFLIDVEVTNGSTAPIYYFLPRYCNEDTLPHNHEIGFDLSCGEYDLHSSSSGFIIARTGTNDKLTQTLAPGATHSWQLKLAAGETSADDFDLPADGKAYPSGIKLYGPELYTDGVCTFEGSVFFHYAGSDTLLPRSAYDRVLSVGLSVDFVYRPNKEAA